MELSLEENSAMYKSNQPTFSEFFDYVLKNPKAKKSYFEFSNNPIRVPSDSILHDHRKHSTTLEQWLDCLENLKNIITVAEAKNKVNGALTYLLHAKGKEHYGVVLMHARNNFWYVNTLFVDHPNSIENWIKEGAARTQSNKPTAPLEENSSISVAISSQTPKYILSYFIRNFKSNNKNNRISRAGDIMKEDLTFFKDKKNKDGSKVKNPKRVFAGKMAHKKHGLSYKQADRASMVVEELKKYFSEAEIDQNNPVNLYALINLKNTTGGFQVQFDKDNYNNVDITLVSQDDSGVGAYQIETQGMDKSQASIMFQSLVNDLKTLADSIDKDFEAILKKNGITRRIQ